MPIEVKAIHLFVAGDAETAAQHQNTKFIAQCDECEQISPRVDTAEEAETLGAEHRCGDSTW